LKKAIIISLLFIIIFFCSYGQFASADSEREWHTLGSGWYTGGNASGVWINGSYSNTSIVPISPALEGDGIVRKNITFIETNISNYVIFSFSLISVPKTERILPLREYFIQNEEIVAVYFSIDNQHIETNFSEIVLTFYDSEGKLVSSQNLGLGMNITTLETPFILNSSGLFKFRIDFPISKAKEEFWVFEDVSKWVSKDDDRKYLTFSLGNKSKLSFQNHYERYIPVFTLNEMIGLQQMLSSEQQAKYLDETAKSVADISKWTIPSIIIVGILGLLAGLGAVLFKEKFIDKRNLLKGLYIEIISNRYTAEEIIETFNVDPFGSTFPFKKSSYLNSLNSGILLAISEKLRNKILDAYSTMEHFNYYSDWTDPHYLAHSLIEDLNKIQKELQEELNFLK